MAQEIHIDTLAKAISASMEGFKLDGLSLPPDTRLLADALGDMIYRKQTSIALDQLPENTQALIVKHTPRAQHDRHTDF